MTCHEVSLVTDDIWSILRQSPQQMETDQRNPAPRCLQLISHNSMKPDEVGQDLPLPVPRSSLKLEFQSQQRR